VGSLALDGGAGFSLGGLVLPAAQPTPGTNPPETAGSRRGLRPAPLLWTARFPHSTNANGPWIPSVGGGASGWAGWAGCSP